MANEEVSDFTLDNIIMIYVELGWTLSMRIQVLRGSFFCSNINKIEEIDYSESEEEELVPDPNNNRGGG